MKIVFWTGSAFETWGPLSPLVGGIGGSETAAIRMAEHLVLLGHDVTIIGQVTPGFLGVAYEDQAPYLSHDKHIDCDVFISSRELSGLRVLRPRCRLSILWCHDIHVGEDWSDEMSSYDKIFCLSEWARRVMAGTYSHVPRDKFLVTRNGIEPGLFLRPDEDLAHIRPVVKTGQRAIYSSSPDRGLAKLLDLWPQIRTVHSKAELHVYYGFENWEKVATLHRNQDLIRSISYLKQRLVSMEDLGVFHHGRVGQGALAQAFLESRLWLYPTRFTETSCITAMEAQAAGAYPITSALGALPETLRIGKLIDPQSETYDSEFVDTIHTAFSFPEGPMAAECNEARVWALQNLSWEQVAIRWDLLFKETP